MKVAQIKVTACDNELYLIASTADGSSELLHYKSGRREAVNVALFPPAILTNGKPYSLTLVGINWGSAWDFKVILIGPDGKETPYGKTGSGAVGVVWTETIPIEL